MPAPARSTRLSGFRTAAMVALLLGTCAALPWLCSCSGDSGGLDDLVTPPTPGPLAEETVGPAGGTIAADGFACEIPAGALDQATDLVLLGQTDGHPRAAGAASPLYRLEGLPPDCADTLTFNLRLTAKAAAQRDPTSVRGLLGRAGFSRSRRSEWTGWQLLPATLADGWIRFPRCSHRWHWSRLHRVRPAYYYPQ